MYTYDKSGAGGEFQWMSEAAVNTEKSDLLSKKYKVVGEKNKVRLCKSHRKMNKVSLAAIKLHQHQRISTAC